MTDDADSIRLTGDHRDIPLSLGMITILWNACENSLRQILRDLVSGGDIVRYNLADPLVVELNSVGLEQALNVYSDEFPSENKDISDGIKHACQALSLIRPYRNYYIHGISAITRYGIRRFEHADFENDTPLHEAMFMGPAGSVYVKSAKNKAKFSFESIKTENLTGIWGTLVQFDEYLDSLDLSIRHYFRRYNYRETAPVPRPISLPAPFTRPVLDHPKMRLRPSLDLDRLARQTDGDD